MSQLIALTGATGFIGRTLVATLVEQGVRVRALTRRPQAPLAVSPGTVETVIGDLADRAALETLVGGADAVIHLAGAIKAINHAAFMSTNRGGVAAVAAAMEAAAPRARLVHLSSMTAREPALSAYAASKFAGEQALAKAKIDWLAVRAPAVYGPGDRETLKYFQLVKRGLVLLPGSGQGRLSLVHVHDLAAAVAQAALRGWGGSSQLVEADDGNPAGYSLREMAAAAAAALGTNARPVPLPRWLMSGVAMGAQIGARLSGVPQILSPGKVREIFHHDWVARAPTLDQLLRRQPEFSIQSGFSNTVEWYKARKWL